MNIIGFDYLEVSFIGAFKTDNHFKIKSKFSISTSTNDRKYCLTQNSYTWYYWCLIINLADTPEF